MLDELRLRSPCCYELFYTTGTDWDDQLKTFTRSCQFTRFEKPAEFTTTQVKGGIRSLSHAVSPAWLVRSLCLLATRAIGPHHRDG